MDAGISYLDNEPLGRVDTAVLYVESYVVVCRADAPLAQAVSVPWSALDKEPLALLTPDMQNRRIINQRLAEEQATPRTVIESNSTIALVGSVASGRCMTVLPTDAARFLATGKDLAVVPLESGGRRHTVGLVLPHRDPRTPVLTALLAEARRLSDA